MAWVEFGLPGSLLLFKFFLKLFTDRTATAPDFVSAILALPVDIIFVAASLLAGYAISTTSDVKSGLTFFMGCMCISSLVVFLWRRSDACFTRDKLVTASSLGLLNIAVSVVVLLFALSLITPEAAT